jgi:hypothetical protein
MHGTTHRAREELYSVNDKEHIIGNCGALGNLQAL